MLRSHHSLPIVPEEGNNLGCLNKITLVGRLKAEPKIFTNSKDKSQFAAFYLVTHSYGYQPDPKGPKKIVKTDHRVVVGDARDVKGLKMNSKVFVEGKLKYRTYLKDGIENNISDIVARRGGLINLSVQSQLESNNEDEIPPEDLF